jgi:hypothetical protein
VSGLHINPTLGFCVDPTAQNAPAWKHERMRPLAVDDRQLKVTIKRRRLNVLPHDSAIDAREANSALI